MPRGASRISQRLAVERNSFRWLSAVFSHDINVAPLWRALRDHPSQIILAAGILLRLLVYAQDRSYWMDEGSLAANVVGKPPLDFSAPLTGDQLAPVAFLIAERSIVAILGPARSVSRLLPLACGILALLLFAKLAARILTPRSALVALALFAFSDDLIYYSSEFKPYSVDLALGLAIMLLTSGALTAPVTTRRAGLILLGAIAAPWCSFSSAFIVAGCGLSLILSIRTAGLDENSRSWEGEAPAGSPQKQARREVRPPGIAARIALLWLAVGAAWLVSFFVAYQTSHALLGPYTTMYIFWDFAFIPLQPFPPTAASLAKAGGVLLEVFVNPLNLVPPIPRWLGIALPAALLVAGAIRLLRRSWSIWLMLVLPLGLAIIASALKRYPLHGRLMLELAPAFFLLIALGTESVFDVDRSVRKLIYKVAVAALLAYPCLSAIYEASGTRPRYFNSHGDLHDNRFLYEPVNQPARRLKALE
jgi:hypothetical protein